MSARRPRRLRDRDTAQQAQLIRTTFWLYPTAVIMLGVFAFWLKQEGWISPAAFNIALLINIPVAWLMVLGVDRLVRGASEGLVQVLHAGGNIKPDPAFSLEDSLVIRGQVDAARATLEARLTGGPEDTAVRLRLADLHGRTLRDPVTAQRWYLEARRGQCDDRQEAAIANGLIDLYRASGQRGRLMVELARFAERWPGTRAAEDARRELREMKAESAE